MQYWPPNLTLHSSQRADWLGQLYFKVLSTGSCSSADTCSEAQQTLTSQIGRDCPVSVLLPQHVLNVAHTTQLLYSYKTDL